jgi:hypothetical protein
MPVTYAASAGLATPQSAIARDLDREHGSLHTADSVFTNRSPGYMSAARRISGSARLAGWAGIAADERVLRLIRLGVKNA